MYFKPNMKPKENIFEHLNKWIIGALFLVAITFPLPILISNIALYGLSFLWLVQLIINCKLRLSFFDKKNKAVLVVFLLLFLWQALSLLYNTNLLEGLKNVESKYSLVLLPLVLFTTKITKNLLLSLFKSVVYSITLVSVFLLMNLYFIYLNTNEIIVYHDFTNVIGLHAVFFSYYVFFNVLLISFLYYKTVSTLFERVVYLISILLSFVVLVIAASKNVLIVTILSVIIGYLISIKTRRIKAKEVILLLITIVVCGFVFFQTETVKSRLNEVSDLGGLEVFEKVKEGTPITESDVNKFNGTTLRLTLWYLGIKTLVHEDRLLIGLTAGDRKDIMNGVFDETGLNPWYFDYNLHNQFVQSLVEMGIVGLGLYLILLSLLMYRSVKDKNWLLAIFLSAFIIFQMTESVLERNKGIVFFIFIIMLLLKLNPNCDEDRNIRD